MMRFLILFLLIHQLCLSQNDERIYIEDGGYQCVENVSKKLFGAARIADFDTFRKYLKIIGKNCIEGKYLKPHTFKTIDKKLVHTDSITRPMILWVSGVLTIEDERAEHLKIVDEGIIDTLFSTYGDDLEIIILSRDKRSAIKKRRSVYAPSIPVVPYEKLVGDNKDVLYVDGFKHFFLYPAMYVIDTDKRITGFETGQYFVSDTITLERALEKSIRRYKKAIASGYSIHQNGVGQLKLGDDRDMHYNSEAIQLIPDSEGKLKSITLKSRVYEDANGFSVGSNIDSLAQKYATTKREMKLSKGSTIIGTLGNTVRNGNILYLDHDKDGTVDWIHVENFED